MDVGRFGGHERTLLHAAPQARPRTGERGCLWVQLRQWSLLLKSLLAIKVAKGETSLTFNVCWPAGQAEVPWEGWGEASV